MTKPHTVLEVLTLAAGHLRASGVDTPRLDAEVLLGHVLGLERIQLYVQHDRPLMPAEIAAYRSAIARRAKREPVAYIVGKREFFSLSFKVDRRVLVPRPETELLVSEVLAELDARFPGTERPAVADIGTGSGAVAVALAARHPGVRVVATDIDPQALAVAGENTAAHGLAQRIELRPGDLFAPLGGERYHAIVSNPPYVSEGEWRELAPEVRVYEPKRALVGGADGLEVVRRLVRGAAAFLAEGGFLALEIGAGQAAAVGRMAQEAGYRDCRVAKDLAGRDRVVVMAREEAGS